MHKIRLLEECITEFSRLPGIGRKSAARLSMHLLKIKKEDVLRLADKITLFRENIIICSECGGLSEDEICPICSDPKRDRRTLLVVEEAKDLFAIEQTGCYNGVYHVLGGKISPLEGIGPDKLRIRELTEKVKAGGVSEVIIATNPDLDGETTAVYLFKLLKDYSAAVTKLASGLALGTHIEYADELTVLRAIEGRREMY
ncbi:MAG: recombination mediator RecR [Deferribacteraceae bacterium]|nr:recombination mediator RecR [Deferribacteraceae bacterium]